MAERKKRKKSNKARVRRTGYMIAAFVMAVSLGLLVWLTMDLVSSKDPDSSVVLKKTSETTATEGTSVVTAPEKKGATTEKAEITEKAENKVKVEPLKLEENFVLNNDGSLSFKWSPSANATGYMVYRVNGNVSELLATIESADDCSYTDFDAKAGQTNSYMVTAFARNGDQIVFSENSNVISYEYPEERFCDFVNLYQIAKETPVFKLDNGNLIQINILYDEGYFTGMPAENVKGYIAIDYMFDTVYVKADRAKNVDGAVALPTSVIGQEGGQINGSSACGPTASAVIVRYDVGEEWNKDDCIRFAEANKLCDQGSMMGKVGEGGMSAPYVIKFIEQYSNGRYSATNVYSDKEKPSETLRNVIDKGSHSILSVRYAWGIVHHPYSIVHFVEPSAYSVENGKLFFYYGDTSYGNGPKGLVKVSAEELDLSVGKVHEEPKCIIVLNKPVAANPGKTDTQQ